MEGSNGNNKQIDTERMCNTYKVVVSLSLDTPVQLMSSPGRNLTQFKRSYPLGRLVLGISNADTVISKGNLIEEVLRPWQSGLQKEFECEEDNPMGMESYHLRDHEWRCSSQKNSVQCSRIELREQRVMKREPSSELHRCGCRSQHTL